MIASNKNPLAQELVGKQIVSIETSEWVTFPKGYETPHEEEVHLIDQIRIKFTDGTNVLLAVRRVKTHMHDGSGGANIIYETEVPHIEISEE